MRVWTNGSFARIWVADTIYRYRDGALRVEESVKRVKGALEEHADEVVAWGPKGVRLDPDLDKKRRKVLDAVALDAERVAAVLSEGRSGPRLVIGPPKGPFEQDIALKGIDAPRVAWPGAIFAAGSEPWSDDDKPSGVTNRGVRVHANEHGVAFAAGESGHVGLWREGDALAFALRVPSTKESRIDAVPTKDGLLVTLRLAKGESAVVHMGPAGETLGRWPAEAHASKSCVALRLDDDKAMAIDPGNDVIALLSLPDLSELTTDSMPDAIVDAAAGPSGGTVVLADGANVYDVSVEDESISVDGPYALKEAKEAKAEELEALGPSYQPARASGPPQIAFPAGKKQAKDPPWEVSREKDSKIRMRLRSGADAGKGIRVEVGGAAVQEGLVRPKMAECRGTKAEFVAQGATLVADLPDVEFMQGILWPLDPKPTKDDEKEAAVDLMAETQFELVLTFSGAAEGNALLSIAVGAHASTSRPLKRIRPVTVT